MRMQMASAGQVRAGTSAHADFDEIDDELTMPVLRNADATEETE
jgi:hypothetical protein